MNNGQVLMVVAGTAAAGLLLGSLVSRRPASPDAQAPSPAQENRAAPTSALPPGPEPEAGLPAAPRPKRPLSDERKAVELHAQDPSAGPESAKVIVVEFSDFQCPYCARAAKTVQQVREAYGDKIRLVFKQHPLPMHDKASLAAQAAAEANAQGSFWPFHDRLFANQGALARADLEATAQALGLDMARFRNALDSGVHKSHVEQDTNQAVGLGAGGTPAFFINGRYVKGAQPLESFKAIVDEELGR